MPVRVSKANKPTYQDVLAAPPDRVAQIINGMFHLQPRPAPSHAVASSGLGMRLGPPFGFGSGGPGGWWILDEPELHFGTAPDEDILVPDLAGWRRETLPTFPTGAFFTIAPDWVCEVLSPSTRQIDLGAKRDLYAREGVSHLWLVDPDARTLEAFALRDGHWVLIATLFEDAQVSVPPFEAVSFDLSDLWVPVPEAGKKQKTP